MLRRRKAPDDPLARVDPRATSPRFAAAVAEALETRRRYRELLDGLRPGPVRERLVRTGEGLDAGVLAVWDTASRATEIERTLATLDPERVTAEYKRAKRAGDEPDVEAVLGRRFVSVQRLLNTLDDTDDRLRLLDARLGAAVAHAAEVALDVTGFGAADALDAELAGVVEELAALRSALDELG
ncbi:MAG: hypothetical protein ACRD07_08265 [Acidimicrobiales bacterium]